MAREYNRKLILENGSEYPGWGFGDTCDRICELAFCTAVVGYQELVSDPCCTDLMVVMTYPLIGNYGIADDDFESRSPSLGALVVGEYNDQPSNFRTTKTLSEILVENHIPAIEGVDTRRLTREIRDGGSCRALLTDIHTPVEEGLARLATTSLPTNAVARVSCRKRWYARTHNPLFSVVAVDFGIKLNIIRRLNALGCNVTIVPYNTSAEEILAMKPDGVLLSCGPGDPHELPEGVKLVRHLRGKVPLFGIGLGHELLCLAYGAKVEKCKVGHHGGNHPVRDLASGRVEITAQGHGFTVSEESLKGTGLELTHRNLLDGTVEGVACPAERVFSVQYQPESAPGPQDSAYLFDRFMDIMKEAKNA